MIEKLKEYKDVIALVVFFLGGLFWIQSQFPTKTDLNGQMVDMKCLLNGYMKLTQDQILLQTLKDSVHDIEQQLAASATPGVPISPAMQAILDKQKSLRDQYAADAKTTDADIKAINQKLERRECVQ